MLHIFIKHTHITINMHLILCHSYMQYHPLCILNHQYTYTFEKGSSYCSIFDYFSVLSQIKAQALEATRTSVSQFLNLFRNFLEKDQLHFRQSIKQNAMCIIHPPANDFDPRSICVSEYRPYLSRVANLLENCIFRFCNSVLF